MQPIIINDNTLYHANCFDAFPLVGSGTVDLVFADLPYGTTACKWDTPLPLDLLWAEYKRVLKPNGVVVLTGSQPFTSRLVMSNLEWFRYEWIWDKVNAANFANIKNRPLKVHEDVVVFSKSPNFTFNPIRVMRTEASLKRDPPGSVRTFNRVDKAIEHYGSLKTTPKQTKSIPSDGTKHPIDIIRFSSIEKDRYNSDTKHPTKKPVALLAYLIKTYTNEGDLVLDNTMGSGTTGVAATRLYRKFIGMEMDETYFNRAVKRIRKELGVFAAG